MEKIANQDIDFECFRHFLQCEFEKRSAANKSYSLRAFARKLDIHPSCLSVILRGKRPLTENLVTRFLAKFELTPAELSGLRSLDEDYEILKIDMYHLTADWKHDAIMELTKCEDFIPDIDWVAQSLEVSRTDIQLAIERLVRLKLLTINESGWSLIHQNTEIHVNEYTTAALRDFQKKALEKSLDALVNVEIRKRYHATMTMAIDSEKLEEAKEMLREFRLKFCSKVQKENKLNNVYQLNMGFYPIAHQEALQ